MVTVMMVTMMRMILRENRSRKQQKQGECEKLFHSYQCMNTLLLLKMLTTVPFRRKSTNRYASSREPIDQP